MKKVKKSYLKVKEPFWEANNYLLFKIIVSLFSMLPLLQIYYYYKNPFEILNYKFEWFCIIAGALIVLVGVIQLIACKLIGGRYSSFISIGSVICMTTIGIVITFFAYFIITFGGKLGTISINTAVDLKYIENYQYGNFKLNCNIDTAEISNMSVNRFSGHIDGNGKVIKNLDINETYLINNNNGTIENLIIESPTLSAAIIKNNKGNIKNITINNPIVNLNKSEIYGVICETNNKAGIIDLCEINNLSINGTYANENSVDSTYNFNDVDCQYFGVISGKNKGTINNSNINGLTGNDITTWYFGGISAQNGTQKVKSNIENCSVTNINLNSLVCRDAFGGISADGYADYLGCEVSGQLQIIGVREIDFGGIVGALKDQSSIKASVNHMKMDVSINGSSYGITATVGGAVGTIKNNAYITSSQNSGEVNVIVAALAEDSDVYVGGLVGNFDGMGCSITNCFNSSSVILDAENFKEKDSYKSNSFYIGGLLGKNKLKSGQDEPTLTIENSYCSGKVTGIGREVSLIGGLQAWYAGNNDANVSNSFFAGKISRLEGMWKNECTISSSVEANNYYASNCGFEEHSGEKAAAVDAAKFKSADFIKNTLGWDENIWNIENGKLPVLKPYSQGNKDFIADQTINPVEDEKEEKSTTEQIVPRLAIIFVVCLVIMIGFGFIFSGKGTGGSSNDDQFAADDWEGIDPDVDWTDAD